MSNPVVSHVTALKAGETADGAFFCKLLRFTASIDPASVATIVNAEQNMTFTGLAVGDIPVALQTPVAMATLQCVPVRVDAANTLVVKCTNPTAGAIDIGAAQSITVTVLRPVTGGS